MAYECPSCHAISETAGGLPAKTAESPRALRGRLRVVGLGAGWFQPDLDRTNPGETSEAQKKSTFQELVQYNQDYKSRGGNPFPLNVLQNVAENYYIIQQKSVRRNMMKRSILAALVFHMCIHHGFTRTRAEAAELLQHSTHGIARGDDYLRSIDEDFGLEIDMNSDRLHPHITSTFAQLSFAEDGLLRAAIAEIVEVAELKHIGLSSVLRSKVIATTFEVLLRQDKKKPPTIEEVSLKCGIRKHTIRRFRSQLRAFHSHFKQVYLRFSLDASLSPAGAETRAPLS